MQQAVKPLSVSVVIPTYERGEILSEAISMALAQDYPDFEVIVVDQSRELAESVKKLIESAPPRLRYLRLSTPNLPGARNAGVRAAKGEIISFIDDDVVIGPEYIAGMAAHFHDPSVGAVMGMTLPASGKEPDRQAVMKQFWAWEEFPDGTASVSWVVGCNSSYRARAIVDAGMCDEKFTGSAWSEDADLSVRVRNLGYKFIYDPRVRLIHLELASGGCANRSPADLEKRDELRFRLQLYFLFKNRAIFGWRQFCSSVWQTYRQYAFNRLLFATWSKFFVRQFRSARNLSIVVSMCSPAASRRP